MLTRTLLILCALFAVFLVGCSKTETTSNSNTATSNSNKGATTTAATAGEKIGVPECDDFIAKYDACVSSKVPASMRAQVTASEAEWKKQWKKLAADPQTRGTLAAACKQSAAAQAAAMKQYGCTW